ncbi:MAG: methyltransferase [Vibrio sp.]
MNTSFEFEGQTLQLHRFPKRANETFQAWDAGDEYVIKHLEQMPLPSAQHILILNDNFGALSAWFSRNHHVSMMTDSWIATRACLQNLQRNQCPKINFLTSLEPIPDNIDLVIMQLPKNNRLLAWQLTQLRAKLPPRCQLIAVNKAKEIHTSTLKLIADYFGEPTTSLAWKKHRLVFAKPTQPNPRIQNDKTTWSVPEHKIELTNLANVYSGESLDIGARFMLEHIPSDPSIQSIIDLGCGNGVLSIQAGRLNPQAQITSVDESFMAVESARLNLAANIEHYSHEKYQCIANNCLDGLTDNSADLVLCNPPFHQGNAITDHIAWQMFCDSKDVLAHRGKLLVVGNRHLRYDIKLKRLFGDNQVKLIAENNKFTIYEAIRS